MQFDFSRQPPGWYITNRMKIFAPNVRLQVQQVRQPMRSTVLHGRSDHFAEERATTDVRQKKDGGDRKNAARRQSHVPGDNEQREAKVFVVAFRAFNSDVGRQYAADEKECIDSEKSI